ncbi:MAG: hypothetical protein IJJ26_12120 [Victivallales bacterium]|nr:hypothetical protein [Victivallales bacterium]
MIELTPIEPSLFDIDFTQNLGPINKRLHSSGYAPNQEHRSIGDFTPIYKDLHFDSARSHDWALNNPGMRIIDTHFLFPLEDKDPSDPSNYYFTATDEVLTQIQNAGVKIFYRLGTSIEHTKDAHFNTNLPKDYHHYAEVLAGIIRHYTQGWANGFHWDIQYWEIWNEADLGAKCWNGPIEEFYKFFVIVLKRLKQEFPQLKIGGPAYTGWNEARFAPLLEACEKANVVPDFLSWHCYTADALNLANQPTRARKWLDERSPVYKNTELILNEWHYILSWEGLHHGFSENGYKNAMSGTTGMHGVDSATFNLNVLAAWQDQPLDAAFYYGSDSLTWGFHTIFHGLNKNYYSFKMHSAVMQYDDKAKATPISDYKTLRVLPVTKGPDHAALLIADYRGGRPVLAFNIQGMENAQASALVIDDTHDLTPHPIEWDGKRLVIRKNMPGSAAFLVQFAR